MADVARDGRHAFNPPEETEAMSGSTMKKRKDEARADDAGAANDATEKAGVANDAGERRTSFAAQYQRFDAWLGVRVYH